MSTNCCGAERLFDLKGAKKELKKYKKSGPNKATRKLLDGFKEENLGTKTLLDIGGGIGAIQWFFLKNGAQSTTHVDYSPGYLEVARSEAKSKQWQAQANFIEGDFVEQADNIPKHDFVTLDKVICCYPEYEQLINKALDHCDYQLGVVYPIDHWLAKILNKIPRIYLWLTKNPFRSYIHPVKSIRKQITDHGFQAIEQSFSFPWNVEIYQRKI